VDRFHSEKQGKYRSWIIPLQILTAGTMVGLANWQFGTSVSTFVLGVALINYIQFDARCVHRWTGIQILKYGERSWGNAVQVGTFWIGYVVGGGLILMLMNSLGWHSLLVAMSIITLLATLPIVFFKKVKKIFPWRKSHPKNPSAVARFFETAKNTLDSWSDWILPNA